MWFNGNTYIKTYTHATAHACLGVCVLLIYMAHIAYENSQLFYDEPRVRGKVTA